MPSGGNTQEQQKLVGQLKDFLEKCLALDPKNRISPEEALMHPFLHSHHLQGKQKDLRSALKF